MHGLKIGHFTHFEHKTGLTVFLFDTVATGAYLICGSAPASHELAALDTENAVPDLHALVFTGGSAYGLGAVSGVLSYLTEQGIGYPTRHGLVPVVPAAAIYDLANQVARPPTEGEAYQACREAREMNGASGRIGAGTGATIGKIIPGARMMTGGLGRAELTLANGIQVLAYAVVNCIGDVRNEKGEIIAGACDSEGRFANGEQYLLRGEEEHDLHKITHTTLVAVFVNAKFNKSELKRIAKIAIAGMGRAISPIFTRYDGDILFCVSLGEQMATELTIGTMAAEAVRLAILDAVKQSEIIV